VITNKLGLKNLLDQFSLFMVLIDFQNNYQISCNQFERRDI